MLDLAGAYARRPGVEFSDEPLGLRQGAGDRGAQLMGTVGGKSPLGIKGDPQPIDQPGDGVGDGLQLVRLSGGVDGGQIGAVAQRNLAAKRQYRTQRAPYHEPDGEGAERHQKYQRPEQRPDGVSDGLMAVRGDLGDGDAQTRVRIGIGIKPVFAQAGEAALRRAGVELGWRGGRAGRSDENAAVAIADLIGHVLDLPGTRPQQIAAFAVMAVTQIVDGEGQQALCRLPQGRVEGLVQFFAEHIGRADRSDAPEQGGAEGEAKHQAAADRIAHAPLAIL